MIVSGGGFFSFSLMILAVAVVVAVVVVLAVVMGVVRVAVVVDARYWVVVVMVPLLARQLDVEAGRRCCCGNRIVVLCMDARRRTQSAVFIYQGHP